MSNKVPNPISISVNNSIEITIDVEKLLKVAIYVAERLPLHTKFRLHQLFEDSLWEYLRTQKDNDMHTFATEFLKYVQKDEEGKQKFKSLGNGTGVHRYERI